MKTYKTIFISDIHLGTKDCKAELLTDFLKHNSAESIYLIGDIIDGWKIEKNKWRWKDTHSNVIRKLLGHARQGTRVVYITGNHDEFLRPLIPFGLNFGHVHLKNEEIFHGINGKKYLITHGDLFDGITKLAPWLAFLGDTAYDFVLSLNNKFNWIRHRLGFGYWSLSQYLKKRVKKSVDFIFKFEQNLVNYVKRRKLDGVICGHIHTPEIKEIDGITYMNDGDWVESCSALVEHHDGTFEIVYWETIKVEKNESNKTSKKTLQSNNRKKKEKRKATSKKNS